MRLSTLPAPSPAHAAAAGVAAAAAAATAYGCRRRRRRSPSPGEDEVLPQQPQRAQPRPAAPDAKRGVQRAPQLPPGDPQLLSSLEALGWAGGAAPAAPRDILPPCGAAATHVQQWLQLPDFPKQTAPTEQERAVITGPWFFRASVLGCADAQTAIMRFGPSGGVTCVGDSIMYAGRGVGSWALPRPRNLAFEVDLLLYGALPASYAPGARRFRGVAQLPAGDAGLSERLEVKGTWFTARGDELLRVGEFRMWRDEPHDWPAAVLQQQPLHAPPLHSAIDTAGPSRAQAAVARAAQAAHELAEAEPGVPLHDLWAALTATAHRVAEAAGEVLLAPAPRCGRSRGIVNSARQVPPPCPAGVYLLPGWLTESEAASLAAAAEGDTAVEWSDSPQGQQRHWTPGMRPPAYCICGRSQKSLGPRCLPRLWQRRLATGLHGAGAFDAVLCPANHCSAVRLKPDAPWTLGPGPDYLRRYAAVMLRGHAELTFAAPKGDEEQVLQWGAEVAGAPPDGLSPLYTVRVPPRSLVVWTGKAGARHRHRLRSAPDSPEGALALAWRHRLSFCHCEPSDPDAPSCADPRPPPGCGVVVSGADEF